MRCSKAERAIELSLAGELDGKKQTALKDHLRFCAACRSRYADANKLHTLLSASPSEEFPSWVHASIMDKVHRLDAKRPGFVHRYKLAPAGALIAMILSVWAGTNVGITGYTQNFKENSSTESYLVSSSNAEFGENSLLNMWSENGDTNE